MILLVAKTRPTFHTATLPARELVPHGIEYLAKSTQDESLRAKAVGELRELKQSGSEAVQNEALISLQRLGCA